ncbi:MAG: ribonuclease J [Sandaracinus sp.]|nr:ribonuclease J [Sandaracinus sp.]
MELESLTFVPLGGLGEVGMNCFCLETDGDLLVVDCGVSFPGRTHGVDLVHPKLDYVLARQHRLKAIVLTHGHEDHVGAVPYLLRALDRPVPIYGPRYALAMVRRRLEEHADAETGPMHALTPGKRQRIGAFELEPVRVNHSIPDATAIIYRTLAGTVIHSGDFKIEERPLDGEAFGHDALRAAGDEGVDLLLSDSTNIDVEGRSGEEADVAVRLETLARECDGRFVVALFASNVYRMKAVAAAAKATGRKVCLLGRSLHTHSEVARELGIVPELAGLLVTSDEARLLPRNEVCILATGTQGEPPAALSRLASGNHPAMALEAGDTVVLSSRIIPGNEKIVFDMIDRLERLGCKVLDRKSDPDVHVSGHAAREEQRHFLELCRPKTFVPVHGTFHHLRKHAALARETGVRQTLVVENGAVVALRDGSLEVVDQTETGIVHVDRGRVVDPGQLRDRELLGELGHAVVTFTVDPRARYTGSLDVVQRGFLHPSEEDAVLEEAVRYLDDDLRRAREDDLDGMEDRARRALKRFFAKRMSGAKPLVTAIALEVPRG